MENRFDSIDKRLEKIDQRLDKLNDSQHAMTKILERLTVTVEVHEKRSTALEDEFRRMEKDDISPMKEYMIGVKNFIAVLKWLGPTGVVAIIWGIAYYLIYYKP